MSSVELAPVPPKIKIASSEGDVFEYPRDVLAKSTTINELLRDCGYDEEGVDFSTKEAIPIQNVNTAILKKCMEYCEYHKTDADPDEITDNRELPTNDISAWDKIFCEVDNTTLLEYILAANYLDIKGMMEVTCKTVANMIKKCSDENEIRKLCNLVDDMTDEEKAQIKKETAWCED